MDRRGNVGRVALRVSSSAFLGLLLVRGRLGRPGARNVGRRRLGRSGMSGPRLTEFSRAVLLKLPSTGRLPSAAPSARTACRARDRRDCLPYYSVQQVRLWT